MQQVLLCTPPGLVARGVLIRRSSRVYGVCARIFGATRQILGAPRQSLPSLQVTPRRQVGGVARVCCVLLFHGTTNNMYECLLTTTCDHTLIVFYCVELT